MANQRRADVRGRRGRWLPGGAAAGCCGTCLGVAGAGAWAAGGTMTTGSMTHRRSSRRSRRLASSRSSSSNHNHGLWQLGRWGRLGAGFMPTAPCGCGGQRGEPTSVLAMVHVVMLARGASRHGTTRRPSVVTTRARFWRRCWQCRWLWRSAVPAVVQCRATGGTTSMDPRPLGQLGGRPDMPQVLPCLRPFAARSDRWSRLVESARGAQDHTSTSARSSTDPDVAAGPPGDRPAPGSTTTRRPWSLSPRSHHQPTARPHHAQAEQPVPQTEVGRACGRAGARWAAALQAHPRTRARA